MIYFIFDESKINGDYFIFFFSCWDLNVDEDELPFNIYIKVKRIEFEEVHDSDIRMIFGYYIRIYRFLSVSTNLNRLLSNYSYKCDVLGWEKENNASIII